MRLQCRVLQVSPSGYYDSPGERQRRRAELAERIEQTHPDSRRTYGSPRMHRQLQAEGEQASVNTVASIMQERGLRGKSPRKYKPQTTDSVHDRPVATSLLDLRFEATAPNQKWTADITYSDTEEGWLYLAVVLDVFSRRVVGWATGIIFAVNW